MPIGILEPFDWYPLGLDAATEGSIGTAWNFNNPTDAANMVDFVTGIGGQGKALRFKFFTTPASGRPKPEFHRNLPAAATQFTLCFGLQIDQLDVDMSDDFIQFRDSALARQFGLRLSASNKLRVYGENNAVVATSTRDFMEGHKYRVVMRLDMVAGTIATKVDGTVDAGLSVGGVDIVDSAIGTAENIRLLGFGGTGGLAIQHILDDLMIIYNELLDLPPIELFTQAPTSSIQEQWTRLGGAANHEMVDEIPFDGDGSYNHSSTVGHEDILQYGALPRTPEYVHAVTQVLAARKDEAAVREVRNVLRIGGVDYPAAANFNLTESYVYHMTHWEDNPDTGVPFIGADFPLQGGYELRV